MNDQTYRVNHKYFEKYEDAELFAKHEAYDDHDDTGIYQLIAVAKAVVPDIVVEKVT